MIVTKLRFVTSAVCLVGTLFVGCASDEAPQVAQVDLQILDFQAIQELIASHRGKVIVMDCWSTSCPPCIREFPGLVALHRQLSDRVACISLCFDYDGLGTPEEVAGPVLEFLQQQQATFDNVLSSDEADELYRRFELASVPAVYVYDRGGQLHKRFDHERGEEFTYADITATVTELANPTRPKETP